MTLSTHGTLLPWESFISMRTLRLERSKGEYFIAMRQYLSEDT
jgi:hypothetical protein